MKHKALRRRLIEHMRAIVRAGVEPTTRPTIEIPRTGQTDNPITCFLPDPSGITIVCTAEAAVLFREPATEEVRRAATTALRTAKLRLRATQEMVEKEKFQPHLLAKTMDSISWYLYHL